MGVRGVLEISRLHSVGAAAREVNAMGWMEWMG